MLTPGGFTRFSNKKGRKITPNAKPELDEGPMRKKIASQRKPLKYGKSKHPAVVKKAKEK